MSSSETNVRATAYAISKDGKPYRSFRLVNVKDKRWNIQGSILHSATNKSKNTGKHTCHLGPLRAAQKIFDAWCRHNNIKVIKTTQFTIQETTRAKSGKFFVYEGFREKLDTPREIIVTNKVTKTQHTIQYAHRSKIYAFRKGKNTPCKASKSAAKPAATKPVAKPAATKPAGKIKSLNKKEHKKKHAIPAKKILKKSKKITSANTNSTKIKKNKIENKSSITVSLN